MSAIEIFDKNIPSALKSLPNWVLWRLEERDGRLTKVPYSANYRGRASSTNASTWSTFLRAKSVFSDDAYKGLGVVIDKASRLVFVDVDHCITDGAFDDRGLDVLEAFRHAPAYLELSQSETGLHVLAFGEIPKSFKNSIANVEVYDSARFCALTGKALSTGDIGDAQSAISYVFNQYRPPDKKCHVHTSPAKQILHKDDRWIIEKALAHGDKFKALYEGRYDLAGYGSHSEADSALCTILAYWADGDVERIDRVFRSSALYREKWERADYRERTIANAIAHLEETISDYIARTNREKGKALEQAYRAQW